MKLSTIPLVVCNILLSSVANATLRSSARTPDAPSSVLWVVGAFALNTCSFTCWHFILRSGEELSSTQVIVSSSMIVLGVSMGSLLFGEIITPLRCLGVIMALMAISVMFYAGETSHTAMQTDESINVATDT